MEIETTKKESQTTMRLSLKLWKKLNELKKSPKETFEAVIWKFINDKI